MSQIFKCFFFFLLSLLLTGCVPVLLGAGAASGYYVGADSGSLGNYISDGNITTKVKSKFIAEKNLLSNNLHVYTKQGVVELSGYVPTETMREIAVQMAYDVKGVKKVINAIELRS